VVVRVVEPAGAGPTPERRVSWRPGAEGAEVDFVMWEKEVESVFSGTTRSDWKWGLV
jgi:hypothetical protein